MHDINGVPPSECISSFVSRENITFALQGTKPKKRQSVLPEINFTCNGFITKWIVAGKWDNGGMHNFYPELQIWREGERDGDTYTKVGSTTLQVDDGSKNVAIYEYSPDSPLEFQTGDVFGIFLPDGGKNRLQVYSDGSGGPLNYYTDTGGATAPPEGPFSLSGADTVNELPLVAVEICELCMYTLPVLHVVTHTPSLQLSHPPRPCQNLQQCLKLCQNLQQCLKLCQNLQQCLKLCQNLRQCLQLCQNL